MTINGEILKAEAVEWCGRPTYLLTEEVSSRPNAKFNQSSNLIISHKIAHNLCLEKGQEKIPHYRKSLKNQMEQSMDELLLLLYLLQKIKQV